MDTTQFKTPYVNVNNYKNNPELQGELIIGNVITANVGGKSRPSIMFKNVPFAWTLNQTNLKSLADALGKESDNWTGARITLKVEPTPFEGDMVDSLRIAKIVPAQ